MRLYFNVFTWYQRIKDAYKQSQKGVHLLNKLNDITVERNDFADEIGFSDTLAYAEGMAGNTACVDEVVGGLYIGKVIDDYKVPKLLRKPGQRGSDTKERTKRRCPLCVKHNGLNAEICIGRLGGKTYGQKACEYCSEDGAYKRKKVSV